MAKQSHPALGAMAFTCYLAVKLLPATKATELMAFLARRFARVFFNKKGIDHNLQAVFPDLDEAGVSELKGKITANFGRLAAEIAHMQSFQSGTRGAVLSVSGALEYPFAQKGKAIYVSAHLGNWELIPIVFQRHDLPLTIVQTPIGHPGIDSKLMSLRRKTGATYVEKSNGLRACVTALKRGESIALLVDQRVKSGIEVDFFARPTLFTHLPARMALRFNCPIILGESVRVGPGHVEVIFHEPIWPGQQRDEQAEKDLTQRMAKAIEGCIRRHPEQWFCNKRRWKKGSIGSGVEQPTSDMDR